MPIKWNRFSLTKESLPLAVEVIIRDDDKNKLSTYHRYEMCMWIDERDNSIKCNLRKLHIRGTVEVSSENLEQKLS